VTEPVNIVVPIKGLREGKTRLAGALSSDERHSLNSYLAERTLAVIRDALPDAVRWAVSPDPEIGDLARRFGAKFFAQSGHGLNAGLAEVCTGLETTRTVYVAADLPDLSVDDIVLLSVSDVIAIAPDESGRGTNALSLPVPRAIDFQFGPDSFARHKETAAAAGHPIGILRRPGLAFDLDTKDDLARLGGWP